MIKPTDQQIAIFDFVRSGSGNGIIEARAGSGKTTTLIQALAVAPAGSRIAMLAFNVSIKDEIEKKIAVAGIRGVDVMTLNAFGFRAWRAIHGNTRADVESKSWEIMLDEIGSSYAEKSALGFDINTGIFKLLSKKRYMLKSLMTKVMGEGLVPDGVPGASGIIPDTDASWMAIIDRYSMDDEFSGMIPQAIEICRGLLKMTLGLDHLKESMTFAEMFYAPLAYNIELPKYDLVFVDEAQDVDSVQLEILRRVALTGARIVAVGDNFQAIYGFRGAASHSMAKILDGLKATRFDLSMSFRCPAVILQEAHKIVPDIEHAPGNVGGEVLRRDRFEILEIPARFDVVLCRYNAPLAWLAKDLMRLRIPFTIAGKNYGKELTKVIRGRFASSIPELLVKMEKWAFRIESRVNNSDPGTKKRAVDARDIADVVTAFSSAPGIGTVESLVEAIEMMFSDKDPNGKILLSSVHRAKGREWDSVLYLYPLDVLTVDRTGLDWQLEEELNIEYVAMTRARKFLGMGKLPHPAAGLPKIGAESLREMTCLNITRVITARKELASKTPILGSNPC